MAKIVDGIKMSEVKAGDLNKMVKAFNEAKLGKLIKPGANPLGTAKAFVKAVESLDEDKQELLPESVAEYFNLIVVSPEELAAEQGEPEEPDAKPETPKKGAKVVPIKPEGKAPAEKAPKTAKAAKAPKEKKGPSNKQTVFTAWKKSKEKADPASLHATIGESVKLSTIKMWLSAWKKGENLPAGEN